MKRSTGYLRRPSRKMKSLLYALINSIYRITLAGNEQTVDHILHNTLIRTQPDENQKTNHVPLSAVTKITPGEDLKILTAGKNGEYIPFSFYQVENAEQLMENIQGARPQRIQR